MNNTVENCNPSFGTALSDFTQLRVLYYGWDETGSGQKSLSVWVALRKHSLKNLVLKAGALAGLVVDITLFPLDTLKTRLQSAQGFWQAGGFRGLYSGIGSVVVGSSPGAALFFCTYETLKNLCTKFSPMEYQAFIHMGAASCGEVASCIVRVPTEVIKQRAQANPTISTLAVLKGTLHKEGFLGLYRGYFSTVLREIPFSLIQFPIWEYLKSSWSQRQGYYVKSWQSSLCGAIAGGIAAGLTTPLDVCKTRIMLADKGTETAKGNILNVMADVFKEKGMRGLFSGVAPRILWISLGGAIFLGTYEKAKLTISCSL